MRSKNYLESEASHHDAIAESIDIYNEILNKKFIFDSPDPYTTKRLPRLQTKLLQKLKNIEKKRVLVYGCGNDTAALWFARRGAEVDAIDISPKSVENQQKINDKLELNIRSMVRDAHHTELPSESYDIIYGNAILHHLELDVALKEVHRLLKPGGAGIFRDVLQGNIFLRLFRVATPFWRTADEHPLTKNDITKLSKIFNNIEVKQYFLSALPYHFFARVMNNVIIKKLRLRVRVPTPDRFYCLLDKHIDPLLYNLIPWLKYQSWICLITFSKKA